MPQPPSGPSGQPRGNRAPLRAVPIPILVFIASFATYLAVPCERASDDNYGSELTAYSLVTGHGGDLESLRPYLASPVLQHRCTVLETPDGRLVAGTGFGVALALAPAYGLAHALGLPPEVVLSDRFNQWFAAVWCAFAVALFYATVRRLQDPLAAWFSTAAFALGSSLLSILSREVWQHSLLILLCALAVWLLTAPRPRGWTLAAAGFAIGWGMVTRPSGIVFAVPLAWAAVRYGGRRSAAFFAALIPWAAALAAYNWWEFGGPFTFGQTLIGAARFGGADGRVFALTPLASLSGTLFSPGRGFFVFSPVFALAVALLPLVLRARPTPGVTGPGAEALRRLVGPALAIILLNVAGSAAWKEWAGGWTYGPRYSSDALVFWSLLLALGLHEARALPRTWRRVLWAAGGLTLAISVANHAAGLLVSPYAPNSHSAVVQPDQHPERLWRWSEFPPLYNVRVWRAARVEGDRGRSPGVQ